VIQLQKHFCSEGRDSLIAQKIERVDMTPTYQLHQSARKESMSMLVDLVARIAVIYTVVLAHGIGGPHIDTAVAFAPIGSSFTLDRIELAVNLLSGLNVLDVALTTSVGGFPGAVLETFHFVDAMGPFGLLNPPLIADSVLHSILSEGTQYWPSHLPRT
jgi:hypothetical protein